jgi:hypothetical protein
LNQKLELLLLMVASSDAISVPVVAQSENGDAATAPAPAAPAGPGVTVTPMDEEYTAYPPPPTMSLGEKPAVPAAAPGAQALAEVKLLSPAQAEMHKEVLGHFQNEAYRIPGVRSGKLGEQERFWLVCRVPFFPFSFFVNRY